MIFLHLRVENICGRGGKGEELKLKQVGEEVKLRINRRTQQPIEVGVEGGEGGKLHRMIDLDNAGCGDQAKYS